MLPLPLRLPQTGRLWINTPILLPCVLVLWTHNTQVQTWYPPMLFFMMYPETLPPLWLPTHTQYQHLNHWYSSQLPLNIFTLPYPYSTLICIYWKSSRNIFRMLLLNIRPSWLHQEILCWLHMLPGSRTFTPPGHVKNINAHSRPKTLSLLQHPKPPLTPLLSHLNSNPLLPKNKISRNSSLILNN